MDGIRPTPCHATADGLPFGFDRDPRSVLILITKTAVFISDDFKMPAGAGALFRYWVALNGRSS
jgi:hypothetical protein